MHDLVTVAAAELDDTAVDEQVPDIEPVPAARGFGRASVALHIAGIAIAMAFAAPVLYVAWRALTLGGDRGEVLAESLAPAWRTVQLAVLVTAATVSIGVSLAWLLTRTDLPLASLWRVLAPLPLVFPSFIGAAAFIAGLGPDGVLRDVLELVGYHPPRRFRGLGASVLVLTLFTYPLVYLPVAARLATLPPQLEESSRLLGDRPARTFRRVILPLVRGAVAGGALLVLLYCLSEFGAVQLLGFDTLTRVVYATRLADRATSFTAAAILVVMAARRHRHRTPGAWAARPAHRCGGTAQPGGAARTLEGCRRPDSSWSSSVSPSSSRWSRWGSGRGGPLPTPTSRDRRRCVNSSGRWPRRRGRRRGSASSPASSPSLSSFRWRCWRCATARASPPP